MNCLVFYGCFAQPSRLTAQYGWAVRLSAKPIRRTFNAFTRLSSLCRVIWFVLFNNLVGNPRSGWVLSVTMTSTVVERRDKRVSAARRMCEDGEAVEHIAERGGAYAR